MWCCALWFVCGVRVAGCVWHGRSVVVYCWCVVVAVLAGWLVVVSGCWCCVVVRVVGCGDVMLWRALLSVCCVVMLS